MCYTHRSMGVVSHTNLIQLAYRARADFVSQWGSEFAPDLECACARASHFLAKRLRRAGVQATFVVGVFHSNPKYHNKTPDVDHTNHCWVEVGSLIVDITFQQFEPLAAPVSIFNVSDPRYMAYRRGASALRTVNTYWSLEQTPRGH